MNKNIKILILIFIFISCNRTNNISVNKTIDYEKLSELIDSYFYSTFTYPNSIGELNSFRKIITKDPYYKNYYKKLNKIDKLIKYENVSNDKFKIITTDTIYYSNKMSLCSNDILLTNRISNKMIFYKKNKIIYNLKKSNTLKKNIYTNLQKYISNEKNITYNGKLKTYLHLKFINNKIKFICDKKINYKNINSFLNLLEIQLIEISKPNKIDSIYMYIPIWDIVDNDID